MTGHGRIQGKVHTDDGSGVQGAVVHGYHLGTGKTFSSDRTGSKGQYGLAGLVRGYYEIVVETAAGKYVADHVVELPPSGKLVANLTLLSYDDRPAAWWASHERRNVPWSGEDSVGLAELDSKIRGAEFWKSSAGIAIIGGVGAALLIGLVLTTDDEPVASPAIP